MMHKESIHRYLRPNARVTSMACWKFCGILLAVNNLAVWKYGLQTCPLVCLACATGSKWRVFSVCEHQVQVGPSNVTAQDTWRPGRMSPSSLGQQFHLQDRRLSHVLAKTLPAQGRVANVCQHTLRSSPLMPRCIPPRNDPSMEVFGVCAFGCLHKSLEKRRVRKREWNWTRPQNLSPPPS